MTPSTVAPTSQSTENRQSNNVFTVRCFPKQNTTTLKSSREFSLSLSLGVPVSTLKAKDSICFLCVCVRLSKCSGSKLWCKRLAMHYGHKCIYALCCTVLCLIFSAVNDVDDGFGMDGWMDLTDAGLSDDPGEAEEEHDAPDVEQASHQHADDPAELELRLAAGRRVRVSLRLVALHRRRRRRRRQQPTSQKSINEKPSPIPFLRRLQQCSINRTPL